jgi:DNA uptake protein ComE-like DNA-binding protein
MNEAENGTVRARVIGTAILVNILGVLPGSARGMIEPRATTPQHTAPAPESRVDINHASVEELVKVPGMTRTWAGRIVRFRPYRTKLDLVERGVLTSEVYERIKEYVIAHREKE